MCRRSSAVHIPPIIISSPYATTRLTRLPHDDDFDYAAEDACNKESIKWLKSSNQVATETLSNYFYYENPDTHEESGILCDTWFQDGKDQPTELSYVYTSEYSLFGSETAKKPVNAIYLRPPTIFGEPHVIKSIRLS